MKQNLAVENLANQNAALLNALKAMLADPDGSREMAQRVADDPNFGAQAQLAEYVRRRELNESLTASVVGVRNVTRRMLAASRSVHDGNAAHALKYWAELVNEELPKEKGEPSEPTFTLTEVLRVLQNTGAAVECATCMSVAFTGGCHGEPHTCERETIRPEITVTP
jgi:hypothetical protein